MKIFETHAHLDFKDFDKDRDELIGKCFQNGIEKIINIGVDEETSLRSIELAQKYDYIYASVGFHPHDAEKYSPEILLKLLKNKKVVAIGEIGLDFYRNLSPKEVQEKVFEEQIQIAKQSNLPIIVHDREAHEDCLKILKKYQPLQVVFHCFSGDELFAEQVLNEDWFISFTGTITYKNNRLENVVRMVPNDRFFVETDSPYLSPHPRRGKRNSPLNLTYIIEKIAELKGYSPKQIAEFSYQNAYNFFLEKR